MLAIDTSEPAWLPGAIDGVSVMPLHRFGTERVALWRWAPGVSLAPRPFPSGAELLVLGGAFECTFEDGSIPYGAGAWLRLPAGSAFGSVTAGPEGALVYAKTGHLPPRWGAPTAGES